MFKKRLIHLTIMTTLAIGICSGQSKYGDIYPVGSLSINQDINWLDAAYGSRISDSIQIVGIGEVTHGGYETASFNLKMLRYLVEHKGYRNILLEEGDFPLFNRFREYLTNKKVDSKKDFDPMLERGHTWAGIFFITELLKYIDRHNSTHPDSPLQVAGYDFNMKLSFFDYALNRYIIPFNYQEGSKYEIELRTPIPAHRTELVMTWFAENKDKLPEKFRNHEIKWLRYHINNMENATQGNILKHEEGISKEQFYRDSVMAQNVIELTNSKKTIIFGHNVHIAASAAGFTTMGSYLYKKFTNRYYSILTDFSKQATVSIWKHQEDRGHYLDSATFLPHPTAISAKIERRFNVSSGIFFNNDIFSFGDCDQANVIGLSGNYQCITANPKLFDSLAVFETISPVRAVE